MWHPNGTRRASALFFDPLFVYAMTRMLMHWLSFGHMHVKYGLRVLLIFMLSRGLEMFVRSKASKLTPEPCLP